LQLLSDGLREQAKASAASVTDDEVAAYFAVHHKRFDEPERRDVRVVLTRTRRQALRALKLLRGGISWRRVVRLLSIDRATRSNGGWLRRVARDTMRPAVDRALFRAPLHRPRGPVKSPFGSGGYLVFEVARIRPARGATLPQAAPAIRKLLESQHRAAALDDFVTDFQQRWRSATVCRSGFITLDCGNAKP
jgi:foldase protein PrsA